MIFGHQNTAVPAITGHHQQVVVELHSFSGNGKVHGAICGFLGDLHRCSLVHMQGYLWILINKPLNHRGQCVAGLSVCGGNRQAALIRAVMLLGQLFDALNLTQNIPGDLENVLTGRGHSGQMFAAAGEYLHTQFIFK